MSFQVKVPTVGESISEVTIAKWNKKDGDTISPNDLLCELESDKATFELNAETGGILRIAVNEGETIAIGTLICTIEASLTETKNIEIKSDVKMSETTEVKPSSKVLEMTVPAVGESITEVTIAVWTKKDGQQVAINDVLCEIESDKATFELTAEASGVLRIVAGTGETLPIGALLCRIEVGGEAVATVSDSAPVTAAETSKSSSTNYAQGHASPAADKILKEKGVSTDAVNGTGKDGRITKEDALSAQKPEVKASTPPKPEISSAPVVTGDRNDRPEKLSNLRKTIARRLVAVKNETAMLTTFNEVDMKPIMDIRAKYKDNFKEKHGVGLGFMSFFTKACCVALKEFPSVNAYINGDEIIYHDYCDISIAVSAPKGLVVPVIRNAEKMNFEQIEKEVVRLALKARDNKLSIEEMTGGTFTLTNGGIFGSMLSTPIINAPQSAILGMHNIVERPVAVGGQVVIRPIMYLALSYDHRIIDGRESVGFLVRVKQLLEDPTRLMFGV